MEISYAYKFSESERKLLIAMRARAEQKQVEAAAAKEAYDAVLANIVQFAGVPDGSYGTNAELLGVFAPEKPEPPPQ